MLKTKKKKKGRKGIMGNKNKQTNKDIVTFDFMHVLLFWQLVNFLYFTRNSLQHVTIQLLAVSALSSLTAAFTSQELFFLFIYFLLIFAAGSTDKANRLTASGATINHSGGPVNEFSLILK